jgi:hypothetical protein
MQQAESSAIHQIDEKASYYHKMAAEEFAEIVKEFIQNVSKFCYLSKFRLGCTKVVPYADSLFVCDGQYCEKRLRNVY